MNELMTIKVGINPLSWTNDDMPSLGQNISLERCLSEGKQAGYKGFEMGNKFPRRVEVLKPMLEKYQLELISGWYGGRLLEHSLEEEKKLADEHLNLLSSMGCNVLVFAEITHAIHGNQYQGLRSRPLLPQEKWSEFSQKITDFASHTRQFGIKLAYHHHMGTLVQSQEDVDLLMEITGDDVGLLLDTGHLSYADGDVLRLISKWGHRLSHIHCKDIRKNILDISIQQNMSFMDSVLEGIFTVPGDGFINFSAIFKALHTANYHGWIVVEAEQDPEKANPLVYAALGYQNVTRYIQKAGFNIEF